MKVGDRVRMDANDKDANAIFRRPDLGEGTVIATTGYGLMDGMYVYVEWDTPRYNHQPLNRPAIQALVVIERNPS